eukprot:788087-Pyramimonas_sp.AAC.1
MLERSGNLAQARHMHRVVVLRYRTARGSAVPVHPRDRELKLLTRHPCITKNSVCVTLSLSRHSYMQQNRSV